MVQKSEHGVIPGYRESQIDIPALHKADVDIVGYQIS
jgi:hypothetical protein